MKTQNQSQTPVNSDETSSASEASAHTPTPWSFVKEQPYFGKERNWGFIKSDAVRACVVSVGEFTKTVYGEQEHYCGVKILPQDVAFILEACNSHASLVADRDALRKALEQATVMARACLKKLDIICGDSDRTPNNFRAEVSDSIRASEAALASSAK